MSALRRPQLYLAAPLFNERERAYNLHLKRKLLAFFDVFLPQEDGLLLADLTVRGVPFIEASKMVFNADISAMNECDCILAVLDGAVIDEGVAFEIGYMFAQGKVCVGLQTDVRKQLPLGNNPMVDRSLGRLFTTEAEMINWARAYTNPVTATRCDVGPR